MMSQKIHSSAVIEAGACLDETVSVGAFAYIGAHVRLAKGVKIGHHALVDGHTTVGEGTEIYPHAKIGVTPQDLKFKGEPGRLIIGKNNKIRESASIEFGTEGGGMETRLGDGNLMMINAHIAHDGQIGDQNVLGMCAGTAGHVTVGSNTRIASLCGVHQFVRIGDMSYIGLSAIINRDVMPFSLIDQNSALIGLNLTGMRRAGIDNANIREAQSLYEMLCDQELGNIEQRIAQAEKILKNVNNNQHVAFAQEKSQQGLFLSAPKSHD